MARTCGAHSFRPRVRPSSPLPTVEQSTPPAIAAATSHTPIRAAPAPRRYDTQVGPTPPSPAHSRPSLRAPPPSRVGLRTRTSHLVRGHRSPITHMFRVQLMTYPRIFSLLLLSDASSSIAAPLQAIQIAIPRKCIVRHIMISQPFLSILSSEIL